MRKEIGFTLIELMVVVTIIGILAAIALPNFLGMQDRARESEVKFNAHTVQLSVENYKTMYTGTKPTGFIIGISLAPNAGVPAAIKNPFSLATGVAVISAFPNTENPKISVGTTLPGVADGKVAYYDGIAEGVPGSYGVYGVGKTRGALVSPVLIRLVEGN